MGVIMNNKTAEGEFLKDDVSNYDENAYRKPSVTVDVAICTIKQDDLWVLLLKRDRAPYRGSWAIPGGFLDVNKKQSLEETAHRELQEETNLENIYLEQLKTYGDPDRDPRMRIITVAYFALVPESALKDKKLFGEEGVCEWFKLRELPENMAFDHAQILRDLLERLKGKISYTPIAFNLLPEKFTWPELQKVYEIILGKKLIPSPFRRKIHSIYKIQTLKTQKKTLVGRPPFFLKYEGIKDWGSS